MVTIEMRFPAGRYHATPWGSHVNEGLVEWPPCPWRLLRTFIATGFSKLGWEGVPVEARALIEKLAAVLPEYRLPRGEVGHTRHYMPVAAGSGETTTKVFDTFVRLCGDDPLLVRYPVELSTAERELLKTMVEPISYLGRAESWLDATLCDDGIEETPGDGWCRPTNNGNGPAPGGDQVTLLSALSTEDYSRWRADSLASEPLAETPARAKKSVKSNADKAWPSDLLDCLCSDTAFLQKHGWSQPPGSRRVLYNRPPKTLDPRPTRNPRRQRQAPTHQAALLSLASDTVSGNLLPLMTRCVRQAEFIHKALVSILTDREKGLGVTDCPSLFGKDRDGRKLEEGHRHAHYFPLDLDEDGRLDHILIHASMGLDSNAQRAITRLRRTWTKGDDRDIFVTCAGFGDLDLFRRQLRMNRGHEIGILPMTPATVWESITPYIPARHLKPRNGRYTLEDDVRRELLARPQFVSSDLAESVEIEVVGQPASSDRSTLINLLKFVRTRQPGSQQPPKPIAFGLRLTFARPINGPIALGYASHFGLGQFAVAEA